MEIDKAIASFAALIGALTGLVTALIGLVKVLRPTTNQPNGVSTKPLGEERFPSKDDLDHPTMKARKERADGRRTSDLEVSRGSFGLTVILVGIGLFGLSLGVAAVLYFRTPSFDIKITKPVTGPLNVKVVNNGTSGEYEVKGLYSGALEKTGKGIYVLVRQANSEEWWLQATPTIQRGDTWYRKGEWRLETSSVGRGPEDPKLQPDENWEIKALIAPESPQSRQLESIEQGQLAQKLSAVAESETVNVKVVINP